MCEPGLLCVAMTADQVLGHDRRGLADTIMVGISGTGQPHQLAPVGSLGKCTIMYWLVCFHRCSTVKAHPENRSIEPFRLGVTNLQTPPPD